MCDVLIIYIKLKNESIIDVIKYYDDENKSYIKDIIYVCCILFQFIYLNMSIDWILYKDFYLNNLEYKQFEIRRKRQY